MIRYQIGDEWFAYEHDTLCWAFWEPDVADFVPYWHPVDSDVTADDLHLPRDYAEWLPDN
jgi:hypothetical protein